MRRRDRSGRADVVYAAWEAMWLVDVRRRLTGEPVAVVAPVGLSDDEAVFVAELVAGRLRGSVVDAIEARYGRFDRTTSEPGAALDVVDVVAFGDARRRLRGRE